MKTPTNKNNLANMFTSQDTSTTKTPRRKGSVTSSKASHGRSSNEIYRNTRPHTADSRSNDGIPAETLTHPNINAKEVEDQTLEGNTTAPGRESPFEPVPDSPTNSTTAHRTYSHSHLGHGPPPTGRNHYAKGLSGFKAKGPLVTSGSVRSAPPRKEIHINPPSLWPAAMSFADVLSEPTPLARAIGYAMKINELSKEDCGLGLWVDAVLNKTRTGFLLSL